MTITRYPKKPSKKTNTVQTYFQRLDPHRKKIALTLRTMVRKSVPGIQEELKWGNPTYTVNKPLFWIYSLAPGYVSLGFHQGARLIKHDPKHVIEGTGKRMRHIKVFSTHDIDHPYFHHLIQRAVTLDKEQ